MSNTADLFSSLARVKVLRTLSRQSPIPLRHIAYLIGAPVFSVQYTLKKLTSQKIVKRTHKKNRTLYFINPKHTAYPFIMQVFAAETKTVLQTRSKHYNNTAKAVLAFCNSSLKILATAKKSFHGTA